MCAWHLDRYGPTDRNGDGLAHEMKPTAECEAIADLLSRARPDILCVQDLAGGEVTRMFEDLLARHGVRYEFKDTLSAPDGSGGLALFSRFPITAHRSSLDRPYSIGEHRLSAAHGFIEADLDVDGRPLTVLVAQLRSKTYHPAGQTEMRRNEARLLGNILERMKHEVPDRDTVVAVHLADLPGSRPWKEIRGIEHVLATDLRPADARGGAWTEREPESDGCVRSDYLFASGPLGERCIRTKIAVLRDPQAAAGSTHDPMIAVFSRRPAATSGSSATEKTP